MKGFKQRKDMRLKYFNYRNKGAYFFTICTQGRLPLFGKFIDNRLKLNSAGLMLEKVWQTCSSSNPSILIDEFIVMPNHVHGIVWLVNDDSIIELHGKAKSTLEKHSLSLIDFIRDFKSLTTHNYINGVKKYHWPPFNKKLWQRSYYDRIIRNETELNNIRQYIKDNPKNWLHDRYNIEKRVF